jgi:hypothetical protein
MANSARAIHMCAQERGHSLTVTRRRFVQGVAAASVAAFAGGEFNRAEAETIAQSPPILTGTHFDLAIEAHHVDFTGRRRKAIKINGSLPGPTLKWREGDTVTIAVPKGVRKFSRCSLPICVEHIPLDGAPHFRRDVAHASASC